MKSLSRMRFDKKNKSLEEMVEATKGLGPPQPEMLMDCGDGEVCPILTYPNPRLWSETGEISNFGESVRKLVADLATTMYYHKAVGIAAPQIGVPARVFVVDILNGRPPKDGLPPSQLLVAINPQIWVLPKKKRCDAERCLSFPDLIEIVERYDKVVLKAQDLRGSWFALGCGSALSRCIQHEYDHLDGILLTNHMSQIKLRELKKQIKNREKNKRIW